MNIALQKNKLYQSVLPHIGYYPSDFTEIELDNMTYIVNAVMDGNMLDERVAEIISTAPEHYSNLIVTIIDNKDTIDSFRMSPFNNSSMPAHDYYRRLVNTNGFEFVSILYKERYMIQTDFGIKVKPVSSRKYMFTINGSLYVLNSAEVVNFMLNDTLLQLGNEDSDVMFALRRDNNDSFTLRLPNNGNNGRSFQNISYLTKDDAGEISLVNCTLVDDYYQVVSVVHEREMSPEFAEVLRNNI